MSRFDLNKKLGSKIASEKKVELGKSYMGEASLSLRDPRKKTEFVEIDLIDPNPDNRLSMGNVQWLKQDILLNGLLQPLVIIQKEDGRYELYAGHQRFQAVSELRAEGKYGNTVEVKIMDLDSLNLPEEVRPEIRKKLLLRSANIQRGNGYATDADRYVVINDWKEIYAELRRCDVEVLEFGLDGEAIHETIVGKKTRDLVANRVGVSAAQVEKFERVENRGVEELKEAVKDDEIGIATAAQIASMPQETQNQILEQIKNTREITPDKKITGDDVLLAQDRIKEKKPKNKSVEKDTADEKLITKKRINSDLKEVFKVIKAAGDGIQLDDNAYLDYLKHIRAIETIVNRAKS